MIQSTDTIGAAPCLRIMTAADQMRIGYGIKCMRTAYGTFVSPERIEHMAHVDSYAVAQYSPQHVPNTCIKYSLIG
jgi:hypothetical protein